MPAKIDVPDERWERVKRLIPPVHARTGRPRVDDRACLATGIVHVLRTGSAWNRLPAHALGVSAPTCWRRLRDWAKAGVWRPALHREALAALDASGGLDTRRR